MRTLAPLSVLPLLLAVGACGAMAPSSARAPADPSGGSAGYGVAAPTAAAYASGVAGARAPVATPPGGALVPAPAIPSGGDVRAGEWDDNANFRDFQRWLTREEGQPFHRVDLGVRRFVAVTDEAGKAIPRCKVTVRDAQQREIELTTTASGRALLFPRAEGLFGKELSASTACSGGTATARFSADEPDGLVELKVKAPRALPAQRTVDVAFILDTTGSMGEEIEAVKVTLQRVTAALRQDSFRLRVGMVAFKDRGDEYVTRVYPMTTEVEGFRSQVAGLYAAGGGDTPESVSEAVHVALTKLDWGGDAVAKLAFLIGDAPPHLDYPQDVDYVADMKDASRRGIQLFTVAASGMDDLGQVVFRQLAQYTGGTNLFVLRGGAGPQSTGGGDPKSSCGGTHENYASGNLDALIVGKIRRELRALDGDPLRVAGLRVDESAKPCSERLLARD